MKKITVEGPFQTVNSGQVELSAKQAANRLHAMKAIKVAKDGAGVYEVHSPIQFKRGETFGYDGQAGKDGTLRDPEAEELARLEAIQQAEKRGEQAAEGRLQAKLTEQLENAVEAARDDERAKATAEVSAQVRGLVRERLQPAIAQLPEDLRAPLQAALDVAAPAAK